MKKLVFAVAAYNLAETSRMLEIAKASRKYFDIVFMTYGGRFEYLIDKAGFERIEMTPRLSDEKLAELQKILNGDVINTLGYFKKDELEVRVESEIKMFEKIQPVAVVTGWCLSVTLSARIANIPFVNVLHSTTITEYYEANLQNWPDKMDYGWLRKLFSEEKSIKWVNKHILEGDFPVKPYNVIGAKYRLKPFKNFIDLLEGDVVFLADIPGWVNLPKVRSYVHYIGPLVAKLDVEIPREVFEMPKDLPIVFLAMGSSGKKSIIADLIEGFKDKPYRVIAPVAFHLKGSTVKVPDNVIVTGFIPADKVNAMADISVIHGGQNTVMNACLSGTPIVGVGMHPEQEANLEACVRKGFAIRICKRKATAERVLEAIETLLKDERAKNAVREFQAELKKWNGSENAANMLNKLYG